MTNVEIVEDYFPGALGRVLELHGKYYSQNWGFDLHFELGIAKDMTAFLERYDRSRDGFWIAEVQKSAEGSIAIDGIHAATEGAHLRWFIVSQALRGTGMGAKLLDTAIRYCRERGYPSVYLHTFEGLSAARKLYERSGFELVSQARGAHWGREVNEQKFVLRL